MSSEFPPQVTTNPDAAMSAHDPFSAELFAMLDAEANLDAAPQNLGELTADNIDEEIARMFGSVNEGDLATLGLANVTADEAEASITARSLTGNLTAEEEARVQKYDADAVEAAQRVLAPVAAAHTERSVSDAIESIFGDKDNSDEDDRELVGAGK